MQPNDRDRSEYFENPESLYSSYGQQLNQFMNLSETDANQQLSNVSSHFKDNNNSSRNNNDPMSYHLYDDYDFNYYLDDIGKSHVDYPAQQNGSANLGTQTSISSDNRRNISSENRNNIGTENRNNIGIENRNNIGIHNRNNIGTENRINGVVNIPYQQPQSHDANSVDVNRNISNTAAAETAPNLARNNSFLNRQQQLAVAQQYYLHQLQHQRDEYEQLQRTNMPFSSVASGAGNQMALDGFKEGADLMFEKGTGPDEGHIMVSAVSPDERRISDSRGGLLYSNSSSASESADTSGIGVYLSEVNGEFYIVDANGNPLLPSLNGDEKADIDDSDKFVDDDEKELGILLINLLNTAAENEKVQYYLDNSYQNQLDVAMEDDEDLDNDYTSNYDRLNLNHEHTTRVRSEQLKLQQEQATTRIRELLKINPKLQTNPKTRIELEKLPEHLKKQIIKDKREREIDAKYIELSEKHNFNPVQLRILQNHLTSYRASSINRNVVSLVNQYNYPGAKNSNYYKQSLKNQDSKKSKYKAILKKFQLHQSNETASLEEETAKIQKNITHLNDMIITSQQNAIEQIRFYTDIVNANCTEEQLKQLYIQSQGEQQNLIKSFIEVMQQQRLENPYLLTSSGVNTDPLHSKIQETLIGEQMRQQEMIKEQQQNLLNLQAMYERGQRFLSTDQQSENIMDVLNRKQHSKNIILDENAPASFHVYKSYKSKKPKSNKSLSPAASKNSATSSNVLNTSRVPDPQGNYGYMNVLSSQSSATTSAAVARLPAGTPSSIMSPTTIERTITPLSSSNNVSVSLSGSPSIHTGPKTRGRKPTKKTDSNFTCPYCYAPGSNLDSFDINNIKPDSLNPAFVNTAGKYISFNRKDHLVRHINSVHMKIKPHLCLKCGKSFARTDNLKNHTLSCKQ